MVAPRELGTHPLGHDQYFFASYATGQATISKVIKASVRTSLLSRRSCVYHQAYSRLPSIFEQRTIIVIASLSPVYSIGVNCSPSKGCD